VPAAALASSLARNSGLLIQLISQHQGNKLAKQDDKAIKNTNHEKNGNKKHLTTTVGNIKLPLISEHHT
jgi:hypothetical protein